MLADILVQVNSKGEKLPADVGLANLLTKELSHLAKDLSSDLAVLEVGLIMGKVNDAGKDILHAVVLVEERRNLCYHAGDLSLELVG